jgi:tetratricopeptide (TPR) repeat protein
MSCFSKSCSASVSLLTALVFAVSAASSWAQASHSSEQVQIKPPLLRVVDPPSPEASVADLEGRADQLRAQKLYLDSLDYYQAALNKEPNSGRLLNKIGISQLQMQRYREAKKSFERSIKANQHFADAYNNLGVVYYEQRKYGPAIKQYEKAIDVDSNSSSFYSNLGAAYFAKKDFDKSAAAYQQALQLDPDVFERSSRGGVQAQLPSPEDRAHYDYTVAKLYAKMGFSDRSLEYLRRAMEEGYKDFKNVYKDSEFSALRKDKRFTELLATKTPVLPD